MSSRFLIRLFLATVAVALLCALGSAGLGWLLWKQRNWCVQKFGEDRYWRLFTAYANVAAALWPGDRDSDGIADGYEVFAGDDPNNASRPIVDAQWDLPDFDAEVYRLPDDLDLRGLIVYPPPPSLVFRVGEPVRLRGQLRVRVGREGLHVFSKGFQLRVTGPGAKAFLVPVGRDGSVSFDIPMDAATIDWRRGQAAFVNAATGAYLSTVDWYGLDALPAMEATVVDSRWKRSPEQIQLDDECWYDLEWPPVPAPAVEAFIEATPEADGVNWQAVGVFHSGQTTCRIVQKHVKEHGPLKFRAIPVR